MDASYLQTLTKELSDLSGVHLNLRVMNPEGRNEYWLEFDDGHVVTPCLRRGVMMSTVLFGIEIFRRKKFQDAKREGEK